MANHEYLLKALGVLAARFPHNKITPETIRAYIPALEDLDETLLEAAISECSATCEFFPTIKSLRDTAARLALGERMEALEAWALVARAARYGDPARCPDFGDPLVTECAQILGWRNYLNSPADDEPSWRARFCEIYNQLRERQIRDVRSLPEVREYRRLSSGSHTVAEVLKALTGK